MVYRQFRKTTFLLDYAGRRFLIDPALEDPNSFEASETIPIHELLDVDAVIATHLSEHCFDREARRQIPKGMKVFVQSCEDAQMLGNAGFYNMEILGEDTRFQFLTLQKTPAFYGGSGTTWQNNRSCGVVISHPVLNSTYIVGESVWHEGMKGILKSCKPHLIIVNTGLNSSQGPERLGMNREGIAALHLTMPRAKIIANQSWREENSSLSRRALREYLTEYRMEESVLIPEDGAEYRL